MNWFDTDIKKDALYKIVIPEDYNATTTDNCIKLSERDKTSGFMHVSYGHQAKRTIEKFFGSEPIVLLLELDKDILSQRGITVKDEQNKPGGDLFPHVYGTNKIPLAAVKNVVTYKK